MPTYQIEISRVEYSRGIIEVEAKDEEEIRNNYFEKVTENIDYSDFEMIEAEEEILSIEKIGED